MRPATLQWVYKGLTMLPLASLIASLLEWTQEQGHCLQVLVFVSVNFSKLLGLRPATPCAYTCMTSDPYSALAPDTIIHMKISLLSNYECSHTRRATMQGKCLEESAGSPKAAKATRQRVPLSHAMRRAAGLSACTRKLPADMIISSPLPVLEAAFACHSSPVGSIP